MLPIISDPAQLARAEAAWPDLDDEDRATLAAAHPVFWAMYASGGQWFPAPHLWYVASLLLQVVEGRILRLCVSVPPQHGKSQLISKFFPTWYLGRNPASRILQVSYGQDLTVEWTGEGRDLFAEYGPSVFGVDTWQRAKRTAWDCYEEGRRTGGGVRGVGKGGGVTGRAVDLGIVDDVIKDRQEADSPALRDHAWKWLESAVFPRARRLIKIATRWHHDDPIGRLEAKQRRGEVGEPWTFVNIPALALENDPLGRKPGEPLWPGNPLCHGDADWYAKKRMEVGPYVWSALYQGQPTPVEGAMFRRGWFRYYEHEADGRAKVPGHGERDVWAMRRFATVDLAASTRTTADYTVVAVWAYDHATRLLLLVDLVRDRVEGPDLVPLLERVRDQWRLPVVFVERMGFQLTVIQAARRAGVPVRELRPDADKVSRALPLTAALEAGRVFFRASAQWLPALESELLTFPAGEHDDQVDALAYGVKVADSFRVMPRTGRHVEDREGWRIGR